MLHLQDMSESLKITIANNVANNVQIKFVVKVWSGPNQDNLSSAVPFILTVTNAIIYTDYIYEDTTFTNDNEYIIQNSLVLSDGALLTIEAGTTISFSNNSKIVICETCGILGNGTAENPIIIRSSGLFWAGINFLGYSSYGVNNNSGTISFGGNSYSSFDEFKSSETFDRAKFTFTEFHDLSAEQTSSFDYDHLSGNILYEDCTIYFDANLSGDYNPNWLFGQGAVLNRVNIYQSNFSNKDNEFTQGQNAPYYSFPIILNDVNISDASQSSSAQMLIVDGRYNQEHYQPPFYNGIIGLNIPSITKGYIFPYLPNYGRSHISIPGYYDYPTQVWVGSGDQNIVKDWFSDFSTTNSYYIGQINYSNIPIEPSEGAHGIVWKVLGKW